MGNGFFMYASPSLGNSNYPFQFTSCTGWAYSGQYQDSQPITLPTPVTPYLGIISKYQGQSRVQYGSQTIAGEWFSIVFPSTSNCYLYELTFTGCLQNTTTGKLGLPYELYCFNVPSSFVNPSSYTFTCPQNSQAFPPFLNGPSQIYVPSSFTGGKWGYGSVTVTFQFTSLQGPLQQLLVVIPSVASGNTNPQLQLYSSMLLGTNPATGTSNVTTPFSLTPSSFCLG